MKLTIHNHELNREGTGCSENCPACLDPRPPIDIPDDKIVTPQNFRLLSRKRMECASERSKVNFCRRLLGED
jgi:hypothetical protein